MNAYRAATSTNAMDRQQPLLAELAFHQRRNSAIADVRVIELEW